MSAFSRAVGAATTMQVSKQAAAPNQTPQAQLPAAAGNPFGIAAVLLQGTQGKSGFRAGAQCEKKNTNLKGNHSILLDSMLNLLDVYSA